MSVGIIGFGDFGKRLTVQVLSSGHKASISSRRIKNVGDVKLGMAVDPAVAVDGLDGLSIEDGVSAVMEKCDIVHWAAPSDKLESLPTVSGECAVVLHDSVMVNSKEALESREDKDRFVIVHCLMNDARRVLVSNEFGDHEMVRKHFEDIRLAPEYTSVKQHDDLMAYTQGVFALMIELGLRPKLDEAFEAGNLTPSAIELREALINREANWTEKTIKSILRNPELKPFVERMVKLIKS